MLRSLYCAIAILIGSASYASAQNFDWHGGLVVNSVSNCPIGNFESSFNRAWHARYRHPNLGDNNANASLTLLNPTSYAFNFTKLDGTFTPTLTAVKGIFIAGGANSYNSKLRITSQTPTAAN